MEADLLVLADLAEVGYADCQVCERPEGNNEGEMILVQTLDDVESLVRDAFCLHLGSSAKYAKHCSPARSQILYPRLYHLVHALQDHVSRFWVRIMHHGILERLQEVLLEIEVCQFLLLQEAHRQLSERVESQERNVCIGMTAYLVEMFSQDSPHLRPLQSNSAHVVICDLYELLQAEHPRMFRQA